VEANRSKSPESKMLLKKITVTTLIAVMGLQGDWALAKNEVQAEFDNHAKPSDAAPKLPRPEGKWDITKYVNLLSALFRSPTHVIKREYGQSLPIALAEVVKTKDESKITEILAELFTTVNNDQKATILRVAEKSLAGKMEQEKTDSEAIALLERLIWGAKGLLGEPIQKDAKNDAFVKAFLGDPEASDAAAKKGAYANAIEQKQEIIERIRIANDPNTSEKTRKDNKKFLRETLTNDAIMAFIEGQMASGNKKLAYDLAEAVGWTDAKSGQKFLEFFNGNAPERLYLGPDRDSLEKALEAYSANKGGLHTATLAKKEHESVVPREYVVSNNGLVQGRPEGALPPKAIRQEAPAVAVAAAPAAVRTVARPARVAPELAKKAAQPIYTFRRVAKPAPASPRGNANTSTSVASTAGGGGNGSAIFGATCTATCHTSWPKDRSAMATSVANGSMPPNKTLSDADKKAILAYLGR
jgi:hypothetical protein